MTLMKILDGKKFRFSLVLQQATPLTYRQNFAPYSIPIVRCISSTSTVRVLRLILQNLWRERDLWLLFPEKKSWKLFVVYF